MLIEIYVTYIDLCDLSIPRPGIYRNPSDPDEQSNRLSDEQTGTLKLEQDALQYVIIVEAYSRHNRCVCKSYRRDRTMPVGRLYV